MKEAMVAGCVAFLLVLISAPAQADDWRSRMDEGNELRRAGKHREAIAAYEEAVRLAEKSGSEPLRLASALDAAAVVHDELGQFLEAEAQYRRALAIVEGVSGRQSVGRAQVLVNMSGIYVHRERAAEAESMLREAIAIYSTLLPAGDLLLANAELPGGGAHDEGRV